MYRKSAPGAWLTRCEPTAQLSSLFCPHCYLVAYRCPGKGWLLPLGWARPPGRPGCTVGGCVPPAPMRAAPLSHLRIQAGCYYRSCSRSCSHIQQRPGCGSSPQPGCEVVRYNSCLYLLSSTIFLPLFCWLWFGNLIVRIKLLDFLGLNALKYPYLPSKDTRY